MTDDVQNSSMATIGVIGAGTMGSGIAEVFAQSGYDVVMVETTDEFLDRGLQRITSDLDKLVAKERLTDKNRDEILSRVEGSTDFDRLADCDLVIEAVPEDRELKAEIFKKLSETVDPETILASNTSSLSITELGHCATNPGRVIGMHFFNPVPKLSLVEVVPGRATSEDTVAFAVATAMQLGKTPIVISDSPGFVVNRLMIPMINEAVFALNEGGASAEDTDAVMRLGASHPMGPLELADMIGLDTVLSIMEALHHAFGDDKYRPAPLLRQMVSGGQLGRKSGQGFYTYENGEVGVPAFEHEADSGTRTIRVLVAKPGLDGHDRGAKVMARAFRDAGFEVIYTGLFQTPEMIANTALQEDVDVVGLSILSGAHMTLFPAILGALKDVGRDDALVVAGGTIPREDIASLEALGVAKIFGPGTPLQDAVAYIRENAPDRVDTP